MANNKGEFLSDKSTKALATDNTVLAKDRKKAIKLAKEEKVGIYGNPLYKQFLGDVYSFLYQGNPVTIKFDGTTQFFPKTIAELLQKKLDASANANVAKVAGDGEEIK